MLLEFFNYLEQPLFEMILSMVQKEKHMVKVGLWGSKKERKPTIARMITTVVAVQDVQGPVKHKTPRVYTKVIEDHDELLQSLLQKGLIQLPLVNRRNTRTTGGFCGYHRVQGHKTCECQKFKDVIQDLVDRKPYHLRSQKRRERLLCMQIMKIMPQHNIRILYAQGQVMKGIKISEAQ